MKYVQETKTAPMDPGKETLEAERADIQDELEQVYRRLRESQPTEEQVDSAFDALAGERYEQDVKVYGDKGLVDKMLERANQRDRAVLRDAPVKTAQDCVVYSDGATIIGEDIKEPVEDNSMDGEVCLKSCTQLATRHAELRKQEKHMKALTFGLVGFANERTIAKEMFKKKTNFKPAWAVMGCIWLRAGGLCEVCTEPMTKYGHVRQLQLAKDGGLFCEPNAMLVCPECDKVWPVKTPFYHGLTQIAKLRLKCDILARRNRAAVSKRPTVKTLNPKSYAVWKSLRYELELETAKVREQTASGGSVGHKAYDDVSKAFIV